MSGAARRMIGMRINKPIDPVSDEPMGFLIDTRWHPGTNNDNKFTGCRSFRSNCHCLNPMNHCLNPICHRPTCCHCGSCFYRPIYRPTAWCHYLTGHHPTCLRCCHPMMTRCLYQQTNHCCPPAGCCLPTMSLSLTAGCHCPTTRLSLTAHLSLVTKTIRPILNPTTIGRIARRSL